MAEQFFSIPLGAQPQLIEVQNLLRRKLPSGATFNAPDTLHVTLVYIEDDKGQTLDLSDVAANMPQFGIGANYSTMMETPTGHAAILRVQQSPALIYLQSAIYYRALAAGMKVSEFSYPTNWRPHITLAMLPGQVSPAGEGVEARRSYDIYLDTPVHAEVVGFTLTARDDQANPLAAYDLLADIPVQEFIARTAPNMELVGEQTEAGFVIQESAEAPAADGRQKVTMTIVTEMRGGYPNIKLPADVDVAAIQASGRKFVTLPIGQVNSRSRNGRTYSKQSMVSLMNGINDHRLEGGWGHIREEDMGIAYGPPAMRWLAAEMDRNGIIWAKGLPLTSEAAQYFDDARLTNARVGTSLSAWADVDAAGMVQELAPIRLDLADPARVGISMTAAMPHITSEMTPKPDAAGGGTERPPSTQEPERSEQPIVNEQTEENPVSNQQITEMEQERDALRTQVTELESAKRGLERTNKDLVYALELLGIKADGDVDAVREARLLHEQLVELRAENTTLLSNSLAATLQEHVKVESAIPLIAEMVEMMKPATLKEQRRAIEAVLAKPAVKQHLEAGLVEEMGAAVTTPTTTPSSEPEKAAAAFLDDKPEV